MREILPNQLWVGNAGDGRDPERLLQAGVVAVVNLAAEEPLPALPRSMLSKTAIVRRTIWFTATSR
jgi:hypothetical protein